MSELRKSPDAVTDFNLELLERDQAARLGDIAKRLHENQNTADRNPKRAKTLDSGDEDSDVDDETNNARVVADDKTSAAKMVDFGERTVGFRMFAHDRYQRSIALGNEADKLQLVFDSRIGQQPSADSILQMVSEYDDQLSREINTGDYIIVENPNDTIPLLRALYEIQTSYLGPLKVDISAAWDRQAKTGTFTFRLFLERDCLRENSRRDDLPIASYVVGCWFGFFPLDLAGIGGTLKGSPLACKNLRWFKDRPQEEFHIQANKFGQALAQYNEKVDELRSSLSLTPSTSDVQDLVGFSTNNTSPEAVLTSFYREALAGVRRKCGRPLYFPSFDHSCRSTSDACQWMKISNHNRFDYSGRLHGHDHDFILKYRDKLVAKICLEPALEEATKNNHGIRNFAEGDSPQELLTCLENLGHEAELTCEGLTVELLDFQKQTLKWAMERETTPGGIQSYLWFKLPIADSDLYFNPVGGWFREGKPREVRGGIIADEMGLGKTIVSLALILKNPAPPFPISGSSISCLPETSDVERTSCLHGWQESLYAQTSNDNKLRGSILSRATLVVCPISLVGQWVEEAKSKLSDPGLIYQYYGPKRTRDAEKIASNSIVVTTYQVLVKDDHHHRRKASDPDYCPPLEQVRWWRIICDEGHGLCASNTKQSDAIFRLVADHKWIVTGTPLRKSITDLINPLKFLGIERVDRLFSLCGIDGTPSRKTGELIKNPAYLRFILRNLMMRHTHNQCYRGTTTTLMTLPSKSERSVEISLPDDERQEYDKLEQSAKDFYLRLKKTHGNKISSHYLVLSLKLNPQRVACSGGHPPLNPEVEGDEGDDGKELKFRGKKRSKVKYSDFCFTGKVKVLIEELKKAKIKDPQSKSLVFSHFISTLDCLKKELPKHGFQFRTLTGRMSMQQRAKALYDFQNDPPTTIFLLSMRAGNCGINLTQANRVFLMEPGFNPSVEKQAIGRVHRLGQKRNVEVIRLFVKDSIESRIQKFLEAKHGCNAIGVDYSAMVESQAIEAVGNLASETPKNKMVISEFDLLFGVKSEIEDDYFAFLARTMACHSATTEASTSSGPL